MSRTPYRVAGVVNDTVNGQYYEFSRIRMNGEPAGYVRILSTQITRIFAQYDSTENPLTELGESTTANVAFEITDPICAVLLIPAAAATITVYAVCEAVGPTETAVLKSMAKKSFGGLM